jgi:hypothetical protein
MVSSTSAKPTATLNIEPVGGRSASPRAHAIKLTLTLSTSQARYADKDVVAGLAREVLAGFPPVAGQPDQRRFGEITSRARKAGAAGSVVGIEGSAVCSGRPGEDEVASLRDVLQRAGYKVTVHERRECAEPSCKTDAVVDWNQTTEVPRGWHSNSVCGGHNYRTCARCKSTYALSSTNSVGPGPSVHCVVCGLVIIEWGSSKLWSAQLLTRGAS